MIQKHSEVYSETQMMSHAGQSVTSLLFWVITMENQTGPIQQTVTFVKFSLKGKEKKKKKSRSFHCSLRPKSLKAVYFSLNKAILSVAIWWSWLLRSLLMQSVWIILKSEAFVWGWMVQVMGSQRHQHAWIRQITVTVKNTYS